MNDFLKDFYLGKIYPNEMLDVKNPAYDQSAKTRLLVEEQFVSELSDKQKELFEKYVGTEHDLMTEHGYICFKLGFQFGIQFMKAGCEVP